MGEKKREVKQRLFDQRKEIYRTGSGSVKTFKNIDNFENIVELLDISAVGLDNNFDSDRIIGKFNYFFLV